MAIILNSDIVFKQREVTKKRSSDATSLSELRSRLVPGSNKNKDPDAPVSYKLKKSRLLDEKLIQYKESPFLNDMLQSNKD